MSARQKDLLKYIEYPESDGKPMAETDKHIQQIINLRFALTEHFQGDPQVYVGSNLLLYYVEGDHSKSVAPDVFFVRGVPKHDRRVYKLWAEGQAPQVVLEISSRSTRKEDLREKKDLYAQIGVREYFIFDPEYALKPPFRAFRLHGTAFVEEVVSGHRVLSRELGLELVDDGTTLRLFHPLTQTWLRTPTEEATARQEAESLVATETARAERATRWAKQETQRAEQEAARAARLAAKLRELGLDPDQI